MGEVPGGRWGRVSGPGGAFGFASDALYGFDCKDGALRASVVRAARYATDRVLDAEAEPWRPTLDTGELRFCFLLSPGDDRLPPLAEELERPPITLLVPPILGDLPRTGSLAALGPDTLKLLALKPAEDGNGWIVRVQETAGVPSEVRFTWQGTPLALGPVSPHTIATWRLTPTETGWVAVRTDVGETAWYEPLVKLDP